MRRFLLLMAFLLCLTLPVLAEEATVPSSYAGEWQLFFTVDVDELSVPSALDQPNMVITEEGILTFDVEDAPSYPLLYDEATRIWYIQDPDSENTLLVCMSANLLVLTAAADQSAYYIRPDASSLRLRRQSQPRLAFGGTWSVRYLYIWGDTSDNTYAGVISLIENSYNKRVYLNNTLAIPLPAFPSFSTIKQAWSDAVAQYDGPNPFPFQALGDIYGYEMLDQDRLLLVTQYGMLILVRTGTPEIDSALAEHAEALAGRWYPEALIVGGIFLPYSMIHGQTPDAGQTNQCKNHPCHPVHTAVEQRCYQIEIQKPDQSPVQRANDDQCQCNDIRPFHKRSSFSDRYIFSISKEGVIYTNAFFTKAPKSFPFRLPTAE